MDARKLIPLMRNMVGESTSTKHAQLIHQKVITSGLQSNIAVCKNLISLLFSCHLFQSANLVFHSIENPTDITLWNSLISSYTKSFMFDEALQVFQKLMRIGFLKPDSYTYPSVLKACSGLSGVSGAGLGRMVHTHLVKDGFMGDVVVTTSLLGMYARCGEFGLALQLFDEMPERDLASWNMLISCYHRDGHYEKALSLFGKMKGRDSVSFTTAISACAKLLNPVRGKQIHDEAVRNGFASDPFVQAALVDMYGKCGCLEMAVQVFEEAPFKNLVSWNSMIAGYSIKGDSKSCIRLLSRMRSNAGLTKPNSTTLSTSLMACSKSANLKHGKFIHGYIIKNNIKSDVFIHTSLLDMYFKCGKTSSAEYVFATMRKTEVVEWNSMISGYVAVGLYLEALAVYSDMIAACVKPDSITVTSVLAACSQLGALERGKEIHESIIFGKFESNEIVMGALLDMYTKCGAVDEAQKVFNRLPERDLISWTTMITAYGAHGQAFKALQLFQEMKKLNIKPDRVVFLAVISSCSHAGLVNEGCYYFNEMVNDYGIKPQIADYACLVDLLGRAGRLHEAYALLQRTSSIREDVELLSTLFSACYLHGDLKLGEEIAGLLIDKSPDDLSTYIVLANMYASIKKWDKARKVRLKIKELGLRKNPGCTWIEIDKKIEPFFVEDKLIPKADLVYECLSILSGHMNRDEVLFLNTISDMFEC